jgi:hypothetical protein
MLPTNQIDTMRPFTCIPQYKEVFLNDYLPYFFNKGAKVVLVLGWEAYTAVKKMVSEVLKLKLRPMSLGDRNKHLRIYAVEVYCRPYWTDIFRNLNATRVLNTR